MDIWDCTFTIDKKESAKAEDIQQFRTEEIVQEIVSEEPKKTETIPIDFTKLKKVNPEIYAWLEIPGTKIQEPIVQSSNDDSFYLDHLYDGSENPYGAAFTEHINQKDFSDFNTVIYGHNTRNVTGFHYLHQFADEKFFQEHDQLIIYTETQKRVYRIFAAVEYDDRHILYHYNNEVPEERNEFLTSLKDSHSMKNQYRKDVEVNENSHVITLSTCIKKEPEKRWIIEAVEIEE